VSLTPPGAEPHDLELAPEDVASVADADLVVLLEGFQPAVDEAVEQQAPDHHLDVSQAARLEDFGGGDEHADDEEGEEHSEEQGADPHFWLDPLRLADVSDAIAERLAEDDPEWADEYRANALGLRSNLESFDAQMAAGLANCERNDLVVSHEAFGYLASRYDLHQVAISGLSPESEPTAATLAEVSDYVTEHGVTTIYSEVLVDPSVAQTVADETGAELEVLDPVEGITDDSAGQDYFEVMQANLDALRSGLGCT
jgi:zinc transport system substrate-binding protein